MSDPQKHTGFQWFGYIVALLISSFIWNVFNGQAVSAHTDVVGLAVIFAVHRVFWGSKK